MSYLLAWEAVNRTGSVCRLEQDGTIDLLDLGPGWAGADLAPALNAMIRLHGRPRALAVAVGPGSFTGIRVAVVAARTLAWIEDLPVHPVDSLAALAARQGDGLFWALMPLKRDVSFHGLYRVSQGRVDTLSEAEPHADELRPDIPSRFPAAVALGPLLREKPAVAACWCAGMATGSDAWPDARGVALAAASVAPVAWNALLPRYRMAPAPEIQRHQESQKARPPRSAVSGSAGTGTAHAQRASSVMQSRRPARKEE